MSNGENGADAPILVTGGTGTLGRQLVPRLRGAGYKVRVLSREPRQTENGIEYVVGDLATGEGVEAAVEGIPTVVHAAGAAKGDDVVAQNLAKAALTAAVRHLVFISVVGADRIPIVSGIDRAMFGYFGYKRDAEQVIADSGIPWTILRATQFYDLTLTTVRAMIKMPVIPVPTGFRFQPIDTGEVADRLVELAAGEPAGLVPDLAGPRIYPMTDLIGTYLAAARKRRPIFQIRLPGKAAAAFREGANLAPDRAVGTRTWEEFLLGSCSDDITTSNA